MSKHVSKSSAIVGRSNLLIPAFLLMLIFIVASGSQNVFGQYPDFESIDPYPASETLEELYKIDLTSADEAARWQALHNVELKHQTDGLHCFGTGDDPFFQGPALPEETSQKLVGPILMKIRVRTGSVGTFEIFWSEKNAKNYSPDRSSKTLKIAKNNQWQDALVEINPQSPMFRFRLDPGNQDQEALIQSISFFRIHPPKIYIAGWNVDQGKLFLDLKNNAEKTANCKIRINEKVYRTEIRPGSIQKFDANFPREKPFESINVLLSDTQSDLRTARTFYSFNNGLETDWITLKNQDLSVKFAPDGSGALVFLNEKRVAVIMPLLFDEEGYGKILFDRSNPFDQSKNTPSPSVIDLTVDPQKTKTDENRLAFEFKSRGSASPVKGSIVFQLNQEGLSFKLDADRAVHGPDLRPIGEMKQALLSGVEYLEEGEYSSSVADIETFERVRYAPPTTWITAPLAALVTDRASFAMTYTDPKTRPIFAVPDFIDRTAIITDREKNTLPEKIRKNESWRFSHRLGLYGASLNGSFNISQPDVMETIVLKETQKRGLPKLPVSVRSQAAQNKLNLAGFLDSTLRTSEGKWVHATAGKAGLGPFRPGFSADFCSVIYELTGKLPDVPKLDMGGAHISVFSSWFLRGQSQTLLSSMNGQAKAIQKSQRPDGSFGYNGKYLKGHWSDTASGHTANSLYILGRHWRFTGDQDSLQALLKGCDFLNTLKAPRGAQVWELSLHTPDIMGASRATMANTFAFEATKDKKYLDAARRWAVSGLPFVYLWDLDLPKTEEFISCRYATIAVFGATNWKAPNWMGRPVQWCGLDYAYALLLLAPHDQSLDWRKIAEGIVISGEQQQYREGISVGLLPDSIDMLTQVRNSYDINPSALHLLHRMARGQHTNIVLKITEKGNRIVAPFPIEINNETAIIKAKKGIKYDVWVNNKVQKIVSNGTDRVELGN